MTLRTHCPAVWDTYGPGFGDLWATLHWALNRSMVYGGEPVYVSEYVGDLNRGFLMREMLDLIDTQSGVVCITADRPTAHVFGEPWSTRYLPTKQRWAPPSVELVAYQFDGISSAELKNPPLDDIALFQRWCLRKSSVRVGLPYSVRTCIDLLANSSVFVGSCSGMSTLALSVGVPTYVTEYNLKVAWWYGPNPVIQCEGMHDFIRKYHDLSPLPA